LLAGDAAVASTATTSGATIRVASAARITAARSTI
jgi:hypothetical protein